MHARAHQRRHPPGRWRRLLLVLPEVGMLLFEVPLTKRWRTTLLASLEGAVQAVAGDRRGQPSQLSRAEVVGAVRRICGGAGERWDARHAKPIGLWSRPPRDTQAGARYLAALPGSPPQIGRAHFCSLPVQTWPLVKAKECNARV